MKKNYLFLCIFLFIGGAVLNAQTNVAAGKTVTTTRLSNNDIENPTYLTDGVLASDGVTASERYVKWTRSTGGINIDIDLGASFTIASYKWYTGSSNTDTSYSKPIIDFTFQVWDATANGGAGDYVTVDTVTGNGTTPFTGNFTAVTTDKVRINTTDSANGYVRFWEIEVFEQVAGSDGDEEIVSITNTYGATLNNGTNTVTGIWPGETAAELLALVSLNTGVTAEILDGASAVSGDADITSGMTLRTTSPFDGDTRDYTLTLADVNNFVAGVTPTLTVTDDADSYQAHSGTALPGITDGVVASSSNRWLYRFVQSNAVVRNFPITLTFDLGTARTLSAFKLTEIKNASSYTVETWNGATWDVQSTITGVDSGGVAFNGATNLEISSGTFTPVSTSMVRLVISTNTAVAASEASRFVRIHEFEVFGTSISATSTWDGSESADWATPGNWSSNSVPDGSTNVTIPNGIATQPVIGATTGAVTYDLTLVGDATLNITSGGSLVVYGTSTGDITYNLSVDDKWHLISAPVVGEQYDDAWVTSNSILASTTPGNESNRAIGVYTRADANGGWTYFQTGGAAATFEQGQGYSIKRDGAGIISFTGTYKAGSHLGSISVSDDGGANENRWNLNSNNYPAYIKVGDLLDANKVSLNDTHESVYVWDNAENGGSGGYKALTNDDYIYPTQSFFLNSANSTSDNFIISKALLSHQTGKTLYKSSKTSVRLMLTDGSSQKYTEIEYLNNKTTGLDPSYDVGTFTGDNSKGSNSISIFTELLSDNTGVGFARQALPKSNFEEMVVPVGVVASQGKELTFSVNANNLPSGIKLYLEDRLNKSFVRLDEVNSDYKVTLSEDLNGAGRFFLHTKSSALSVSSSALEGVNVYKLNEDTLKVVGLTSGENAAISMYNILGKTVLNTKLGANISEISLPKLSTGIYIVKLTTDQGELNKKIILE